MKKLLIVAVLALCLTALVGSTVAVGSGRANSTGTSSARHLFVYVMQPGDYIEDSSTLDGLLSEMSFDVFIIVNASSSAGNLRVEIEDIQVPGDTILGILTQPGVPPIVSWAASPSWITLSASLPEYGWVLVIAGYIDCPAGFPASYNYRIWL